MPESPNERVFLVRQALGTLRKPLPMEPFAERLTLAARQLGLALRYHPSTISDIEAGNRAVSLDDARVVAAVDPLHRGAGWLAFGEASVVPAKPTLDELIATSQPMPRPAPKPVVVRKRGRGGR